MTRGDAPPFGALLRRHRLAAGLSQEALAERAGLSTRGISDLERGVHRVPRPETAAMLADALKLDGAARAALLATLLRDPEPELPAAVDGPAVFPTPLTALLGRESEERALIGLLRGSDDRSGPRLVTLTGPGGVGKTRLALEVAHAVAGDFADGVWLVDLAPLRDSALVVATIADTLGVREEGQRALRDALIEQLRPRELLLLLDNFEQVLAAAPLLATVLAACPRARALVTSRAPLQLRGEQEFPVPPLALPGPADAPLPPRAAYPAAVSLFVQRAREARPGFHLNGENAAIVAALCRRLDGLPLALELAAAQVRLLPPGAVLARLERRLPLPLAGPRDLPARQRTLHDTLDWSHDLLTTEQRTLFRRLAIFSGGGDLAAVLAVCGTTPGDQRGEVGPLDDLLALASLSLLRAEEDAATAADGDGMRFGMLETVREYAAERLDEAGEAAEVARRHADHYLALAGASSALAGPGRAAWLARLDRERDNLRAAWRRALEEDRRDLLAAADGLGRYLEARAHAEEGADSFAFAVTVLSGRAGATDGGAGAALLAALLAWRGTFRRVLGQLDAAESDLREALARLDAAADPARDTRALRAFALLRLGQVAWDRGHQAAAGLYERSLALYRDLDRPWETSAVLWELGRLGYRLGWYAAADERLRESLALREARGDAREAAEVLQTLSQTAAATGRFDEALRLARRANDLLREVGDEPGRALGLRRLGVILAWAGQPAAARPLLEESLARYTALRLRGELGWAHFHLSSACVMLGDYAGAEEQARRAIVFDGESGSPANLAHDLWMLGVAQLARGAAVEAEATLREAVALSGTGEDGEVIWPLPALAYVVWRRGDTAEARRHLCAALRAALARRDTLTALTALPPAALLLAGDGRAERAVELAALAWRHPTVANNRSSTDVWQRDVEVIAAALPPEAAAAARARGEGFELWASVAALLDELAPPA